MAHLNPPKKQQGIVLILALIMVVAVTGIAVTLMNSSSIDAKITAAVQEREVAENEVNIEVTSDLNSLSKYLRVASIWARSVTPQIK